MGSMSGIGALLGTMIMASLPSTKRPGLLFIIGAAAFGAGVFLVSLSQLFSVSLAILFGLGVGQSAYFVLQTSLILLVSSDKMRGRAMGILTLGIGAGPIGTLMVGYFAEIYGAPLAVSSAAAIGLILLVLITFSMPQLVRTSGKPDKI
jgi:predicted MFS family arabinose efflux permease